MKTLRTDTHPRSLFLAQRSLFFLLSIVHDIVIAKTVPSAFRRTALILFASSATVLVFLVRPFSNAIEALLLTLSLAIYARLEISKHNRTLLGILLGVICALGVWTRVTFPAFVLWLPFALITDALLLLVTGASFIVTALVLLVVDSTYFSGTFPPSHWTLTPVALLVYNTDAANLALHGIHPRWLHVIVNGPMVFGFAGWLFAGISVVRYKSGTDPILYACRASVISGIALLSLQPHQEPRFLAALAFPISVLSAHTLTSLPSIARPRATRHAFWVFHILCTAAITLLLGYLHQGGILPALFRLADLESGHSPARLIGWKLFGFPRAFVDPARFPRVVDMGGADVAALAHILCSGGDGEKNVVLAPGWTTAPATGALEAHGVQLREMKGWGPGRGLHVDMDRLDQLLAGGWNGLGVCALEAVCLGDAHKR